MACAPTIQRKSTEVNGTTGVRRPVIGTQDTKVRTWRPGRSFIAKEVAPLKETLVVATTMVERYGTGKNACATSLAVSSGTIARSSAWGKTVQAVAAGQTAAEAVAAVVVSQDKSGVPVTTSVYATRPRVLSGTVPNVPVAAAGQVAAVVAVVVSRDKSDALVITSAFATRPRVLSGTVANAHDVVRIRLENLVF